MISLSDHYNALHIDRLSSKIKIGKDLWHFNSSLLKKKDFCSTTINMLSILGVRKKSYSSQLNGENTLNIKSKIIPDYLLKILQNRKTSEFLYLKRDFETYTKKRTLNLKSE